MQTITSVIFKNAKRREKISKDGKAGVILSALSFFIVFGALSGVMIWASIYITNRLMKFNQTYAFVNLMLFFNFGLLFVKSIFEGLNVLYFSKDLKVFLRMPIKSIDLIHGKLLKMITSEYEMEIIMLAIPMIVYGIITGAKFGFYLYIAIVLLILPIIPICITATILSIIMRITNSIKNKSKVMYLTIIISAIIIDVILTGFGTNRFSISEFRESILIENYLAEEIANHFKLIIPIMNSLLNYDNIDGIKNIILYLGISLLTYLFSLIIISKLYLKGAIGTVISGDKKLIKEKINLKLEDFKKKNLKRAYLNKEFLIIRRSPIFFIECLFLPVLFSGVILGIAIAMLAFSKAVGFDMLAEVTIRANKPWGVGIFLSVGQVFNMINFSSIIAISKEERWAVLSKYLPIRLSKQIDMKLFIGKLTNFIAGLAVVIWYYVCTRKYSLFYDITYYWNWNQYFWRKSKNFD